MRSEWLSTGGGAGETTLNLAILLTFWRLYVAEPEGIAGVAWTAGAGRQMVHHLAVGVGAASARTRVLAPVADTGTVGCTIRIQHALRTTAFVRVTNIIWKAGA